MLRTQQSPLRDKRMTRLTGITGTSHLFFFLIFCWLITVREPSRFMTFSLAVNLHSRKILEDNPDTARPHHGELVES